MTVDGKDELEMQDDLNRVQMHIAQLNQGELTTEEAYKAVKNEVTKG